MDRRLGVDIVARALEAELAAVERMLAEHELLLRFVPIHRKD